MNIKRNLYILISLFILNGCAFFAGDPHENFINSVLKSRIGESMDTPRTNIIPQFLLSTRILDNGNIQYRYSGNRGCIEIYEVNPQTRIIINATFEGTEKTCVLYP